MIFFIKNYYASIVKQMHETYNKLVLIYNFTDFVFCFAAYTQQKQVVVPT